LPFEQADGSLYDRFCGKPMYITVFQPKYIASEMKRADLAATNLKVICSF
jgi:hypothetical protein